MQIVVSSPSGYIYRTTPTPKAQGILQKRGQKDYKSQRIGELAVRVCLLVMSEAITIESQQYNCPNIS